MFQPILGVDKMTNLTTVKYHYIGILYLHKKDNLQGTHCQVQNFNAILKPRMCGNTNQKSK